MKQSILIKYALVIFISVTVSSCLKNPAEQPLGCEPAPPLVLAFNVLDAGTGQDLFFSSSPRYPVSNLYFFRKKDQVRKDTIRPAIVEIGTTRIFTLAVTNLVGQDTLLMRIFSNPDDQIIYSMKNGTGECPYLTFDKVLLNGTTLTATQGKFSFLK